MKNKWYHIKAYDTSIGTTYTFWVSAKLEDEIRKTLKKKKYKNIEWIREEIPPFI